MGETSWRQLCRLLISLQMSWVKQSSGGAPYPNNPPPCVLSSPHRWPAYLSILQASLIYIELSSPLSPRMEEETSDVSRENTFINYVENFLFQLYQYWKSQRNCESCNALAIAVGIEEIIYKKAYSENQIMNQMNSIPLWKKTDVLAWYKRQCELILKNFENAKVDYSVLWIDRRKSKYGTRELSTTGESCMMIVSRIQVSWFLNMKFKASNISRSSYSRQSIFLSYSDKFPISNSTSQSFHFKSCE